MQDYAAKNRLSRLIVSLVREELDLSTIVGSYASGLGQPPFDPRPRTAQTANCPIANLNFFSFFTTDVLGFFALLGLATLLLI